MEFPCAGERRAQMRPDGVANPVASVGPQPGQETRRARTTATNANLVPANSYLTKTPNPITILVSLM